MKQGMCVSVVLAILAATGVASAQEARGKQGDFAISIERAMGIYLAHTEYDIPVPDDDRDVTGFELGIRANGVIPSNGVRLGLDYWVIDGLSIGGGFGFSAHSDDDNDDAEGTLFLIAPRVGYFLGLGEHFGFWPRGGFTFWTQGGTNNDANQLMVTLEGMFTLAPSDDYAFLVGPVVDLGFVGEQEVPGPGGDIDRNDRLLGIAIGMTGFL